VKLMWRILHITDLHIEDPRTGGEQLRDGRFREYLGELLAEIAFDDQPQADCIVATGDFVHKGKTTNFLHARKVLAHLASSLELSLDRVAVCIGNHDVLVSEEEKNNLDEARAPFKAFADDYANGSPTETPTECAVLCHPAEGIWCVSLDSTRGEKPKEPGGEMSIDEIDQIVRWVDAIPTSELLVVAAHYPVDLAPGCMDDYHNRDPDFFRHHRW
jgi:3',5'-cyclic AMP phosphodiesterase CpdA